MLLVTGLLLFLATAIVVDDWRRSLFVAVAVAVLQDPLRKLTPGEPVVYVVLVGVVIGIAALAASISGVSLMPSCIRGWRRYLAVPFGLFIAILVFQALNSLTRFGNIFLPAIGCLTYLTPFVAMSLIYQAVLRSSDKYLTKFLQFYVVCVSLALTTVYLEYIGYGWPILGEVGTGIVIHDFGHILSAYSGLFRSSELAAWHAATSVCFLAILIVSRPKITLGMALWATMLMLVIIGLGVLTGRRKFLMEIVVFASAYTTLLFYFGRGAARLALLSAFVGVLGALVLALVVPDDPKEYKLHTTSYDIYVQRSQSVFKDVPDRITGLGLAPITWAYNRYGLLGAGLGVGSQGTQYFGGVEQGAAEGGLGKIWVELGAPGLLIVAWLGWALARHLWSILKLVSRQSLPLSRTACGLASFLVANVATFMVATQVYGDIFVLFLLGTALAAIMAMPVLAERALQKRMMRLAPSPSDLLVARPT